MTDLNMKTVLAATPGPWELRDGLVLVSPAEDERVVMSPTCYPANFDLEFMAAYNPEVVKVLMARIQGASALHTAEKVDGDVPYCARCLEDWPCRTKLILDGTD